MKRTFSVLAIFAIGATVGWFTHPVLAPNKPAFQYELKRYPAGPRFYSKQLSITEWQLCQLGQKFYCSVIAGDDTFTAHLKAVGR